MVKNLSANEGNLGSILGLGRSREGNGNPLQYSCLEDPHGQRRLAGYSPWGVIELDMTEATEHKEQLLIIFRCMVFNLFS